ncbi:histone acetyltransferase [Stylonychia lemnae]|uniref:Histone acetyltransferase n=1 Tax=Stylonychia lemnae TaxID=5949 RepID=A0A077ZRV3_STYLE|nr:histone acetyltransferase [Stylonychia lemnae]|eukprot:CDW72090.1 histone acetyltransferase [Stylonychia lemnae]
MKQKLIFNLKDNASIESTPFERKTQRRINVKRTNAITISDSDSNKENNSVFCNQSCNLKLIAKSPTCAKLIKQEGFLTNQNYHEIVEFKEIVCSELPRIGRPYLIKKQLNFDYKTILIKYDHKVKYRKITNNQVLGGCLFKPYLLDNFIELVYFCIDKTQQGQVRIIKLDNDIIQGLGNELMDHLKAYAQKEDISYIIAYADNNAIQFFKKQGFIHEISLPKTQYMNLIEHFVGAQLMGFKIIPELDYLNLKSVLQRQVVVLAEALKNLLPLNQLYLPYYIDEEQRQDIVDSLDPTFESSDLIEVKPSKGNNPKRVAKFQHLLIDQLMKKQNLHYHITKCCIFKQFKLFEELNFRTMTELSQRILRIFTEFKCTCGGSKKLERTKQYVESMIAVVQNSDDSDDDQNFDSKFQFKGKKRSKKELYKRGNC